MMPAHSTAYLLGRHCLLATACLLASSAVSAAPLDRRLEVFHFDAGPVVSKCDKASIPLHKGSTYEPSIGYGWVQLPNRDFTRANLARSRDSRQIDGVAGPHLVFRVDVEPGEWMVLAEVEAEYSQAKHVNIFIQGAKQNLNWQEFLPASEPRQSPENTYRVCQAKAALDKAGLTLEFRGVGQEVGILGISLIKLPAGENPQHRQLLQQLGDAGSHRSETPLSRLLQQTEKHLMSDPSSGFYSFWREQIRLLTNAELLFEKRGWSWAREDTGLGMFDRMHQAVMLIDGLLSCDGPQVDLLGERALYLRGRLLYWLHRERGGVSEKDGALRDLGEMHSRYPEDSTLAMYVGDKINLPDPCDRLESSPNAPAWSIAQREALCRMRQIARWWVQQRQSENGELGGKLGDDVEILRWWSPLLLSGDPVVRRGWENLAKGVWNSDEVRDGYATKISDVEHAAEFIADSTSLLAVASDEPVYLDRLSRTAEHFDKVWTGLTAQGNRLFRSAWFNAQAVETVEPKGRDVEYNTRAVQPMRYLAWRRRDPQLDKLLHEWSMAWVRAALRTDKGKPKGIIPASIRFSDEEINGDEPTWYLPNMYWSYYDWEHHTGSLMLDQLLFTYLLTQDEQLLRPLRLALELARTEQAQVNASLPGTIEKGSQTWAARTLMQTPMFWNVVEQWRYVSRDSQWDDLILRYGSPYARYRLTGDEQHLLRGLESILDDIRYNTPMKTIEAYHTDRVYVPNAELLKAMLTGDGMIDNVSPYYAVTWERTDEHFTALVTDTGIDHLTVQVFSHRPEANKVMIRLWQLVPGEYTVRISSSDEQTRSTKTVELAWQQKEKGQRMPIDLLGQTRMTIRITRKKQL